VLEGCSKDVATAESDFQVQSSSNSGTDHGRFSGRTECQRLQLLARNNVSEQGRVIAAMEVLEVKDWEEDWESCRWHCWGRTRRERHKPATSATLGYM